MKKTNFSKLLSLLLVLVLAVSLFAGCSNDTTDEDTEDTNTTQNSGDNTDESTDDTTATDDTSNTDEGAADDATADDSAADTPLVAGYSAFSAKFSPFFADTAYDQDAVSMTQLGLLTTDRMGGIVYNAIEGEVIPYNGTDYTYTGIANVDVNYDEAADQTVYTWTIRDDVKFSDGELMTADDIIFSYYVYSDPAFDGSATLYSAPIVGMQDYRTQTSSEVYDKYNAMFDAIVGEAGDGSYTDEQAASVATIIEEEWMKDVQAIVDYCYASYAAYYPDYAGFTADEAADNEGIKIAAGMALWGFGSVDTETKVLTTAVTEKVFNMADGEFPTLEDYYNETVEAYGGVFADYAAVETPGDVSPFDIARDRFIAEVGSQDESMGDAGVPNIAGIVKLNDTTVQVTLDGFDAAAIYKLGVSVSPLHYYGDVSLYDYDNNMFGFPYGDLSGVKAKTDAPMGAGPYKFVKYENKVIYYEANENYYKGEPKTKYVQFKEGSDDDKISGVGTGTIDVTDPSFGTAAVEEIKSYNSNGEVTGDTITTNTVDNLGYGYIGISAKTVNVGGVPDSEESKNLRKAFATILSVYRDISIDSYYGERASIINYPISNTSWAAPQKSDEGYEVAFSKDVDGNPIYTSDMDAQAKYDAAIDAAIAYLQAAGFTYDGSVFTAAPEGARLQYEIIVPGDGGGDHPSFMIASMFKETFDALGFDIILNDPTDANILWDKLDAETQDLWCAAWGATIDPDMYQIYHSDNSSHSNHYHIADATLDNLIMEARTSDDQAFRKVTYKAALDVIIDWAVEVPIYQRQNCVIFSSERVNLDTITPDITTFWGWMNDLENVEMN